MTKIQVEEEIPPLPKIMLSRKHTIAADDVSKLITITVSGRGFLYNMVRIIAGTLIEVGRGNRERQSAGRQPGQPPPQTASPSPTTAFSTPRPGTLTGTPPCELCTEFACKIWMCRLLTMIAFLPVLFYPFI